MKNREIAIYGLYMAIFLIIGLVPYIGLIRIGPISFTIIALPITMITVHKGQKGALFGLLMFALTSSIALFYLPEGAFLISNLGIPKSLITLFGARILIFISLSLYLLITKNKQINNYLNGFIITLIISISNTIFIFCFFVLFLFRSFWEWFIILGITNILPEWTIIPFFGVFVAKLGQAFKKKDQNIKKISYN